LLAINTKKNLNNLSETRLQRERKPQERKINIIMMAYPDHHNMSEDQFYSYSDDESGSLSDAYFLPAKYNHGKNGSKIKANQQQQQQYQHKNFGGSIDNGKSNNNGLAPSPPRSSNLRNSNGNQKMRKLHSWSEEPLLQNNENGSSSRTLSPPSGGNDIFFLDHTTIMNDDSKTVSYGSTDLVGNTSLVSPDNNVMNGNQLSTFRYSTDSLIFSEDEGSDLPSTPRKGRSTSSGASPSSNNPYSKHHHPNPHTAHLANLSEKDQKLYRKIQQKQREQIAREQAVKEIRGSVQPLLCRDYIFALIFVAQLVMVAFTALRFGSSVVLTPQSAGTSDVSTIRDETYLHGELDTEVTTDTTTSLFVSGSVNKHTGLADMLWLSDYSPPSESRFAASESLFTIDYKNVIALCGITGFYACIISMLTVGFMLIIAKSLIQTVLVFSVVLSLGWGVIGLSLGDHSVIPFLGFVALFLTLGYTIIVWDRIPFAATNLHTALCAMRCTADITLVGLGFVVVTFLWCWTWCTAFIGVVDNINTIDCTGPDRNDDDYECVKEANRYHWWVYALLLFSFYWTNLVLKNIVQVTVASAVGTWWFHPEAMHPCFCTAVSKPLLRSVTTSLGSICFGSLILLPCQCLAALGDSFCYMWGTVTEDHDDGDDNDFEDEHKERLGRIGPLRKFARKCNRWSFTYIGMYGYSFLDAGEKAIQLFETRGWMAVVSDNLIHNVLFMASIVMGGSTGVFGVVVEEVDGFTLTSFHKPIITAFLLGSVLGFVLSNILLMGVVGGALNTVLVCFAAGPFEFHKNHPRLSQTMRDMWSQQVWEENPV